MKSASELERELCGECRNKCTSFCGNCKEYDEYEPCEDVIIREDLEECKELMTDINGDTVYAVRMSDIRHLPPVTQKSGKWIERSKNIYYPFWERYICSECESVGNRGFKYCPSCGAKMESED